MLNTLLNKGRKAALMATVFATSFATLPAHAGLVTLGSADGSINMKGEFVEYGDGFYVISTSLGNLRISAARVNCEGESCPVIETTSADINIVGSQSVGVALMPLLMEGYAAQLDAQADIEGTGQEGQIYTSLVGDQGFGDEMGSFLVTSTNSNDAFAKLQSNDAKIAMASRRILPAEARALRDAGGGNMVSPAQEHIVAVDSVVVVTHPQNPVQQLSTQQVADIYAGRITNWKQVGGEDLEIKFVARENASDIGALFQERVLNGEATNLTQAAFVAQDHNDAASFVTSDKGAIGYVGYAFLRGSKPLPLVNECGIAMIPDAFSAKTEEYALQRRVYLYNREDNTDDATRNFLDYATSEAADQIILKSGFIDLGISRRSQDIDSERAQSLLNASVSSFERDVISEMTSQMANYDRLSTTFRFRTGSSKLDERGQLDMQRLIRFLEEEGQGAELMIVGFTDDVGAFGANQRLSVDRAQSVASQVAEYGAGRLSGVTLRVAGYGEIAPAACNVSNTGRGINRRVEVWVKSKA